MSDLSDTRALSNARALPSVPGMPSLSNARALPGVSGMPSLPNTGTLSGMSTLSGSGNGIYSNYCTSTFRVSGTRTLSCLSGLFDYPLYYSGLCLGLPML
jgi:hypothetical protein